MTLYSELPEVESQLARMGITVDGLLSVVRAAGAGSAATTDFHPRSAPGTFAYHEGTAALRRLLVPAGYQHDEEDSQPRTFSPERGVSIILHAGDENTGADTGIEPRSRNAHGGVTARKTQVNHAQLLLPFTVSDPDPDIDETTDGHPRLFTWVLLIAIVGEQLRSELSLPRAFEVGKVTGWAHRILLPEQPFGGAPLADAQGRPDEGPEDEVAVEWK